MKNNHFKHIILGAGISGLAAGVEFEKHGEECLILEKENEPGGLCRSVKLGECEFDLGPKILLLDKSEIGKEILSYLGNNYSEYPISEGAYISKYGLLGFPLQRHLYSLPKKERDKILNDIEKIRKSPVNITNYKSWLVNGFGEYFCNEVLFPYEEKKWQIGLDKLDYKWALNRPIKVDYDEIIQGSIRKLPPKGSYYYPKTGSIYTLVSEMAKKCCPIRLNQEVVSIDIANKCIKTTKETFYYENLVSSIPVNVFLDILKRGQDTFTNSKRLLKGLGILVANLVYKGNYDLQGNAIYFPEKKYIFRRVSVLQNLCPALARKGYTPIQIEVSIKGRINEKEIISKILHDLKEIKQFSNIGDPSLVDYLIIDFAYPLPSTGLEEYISRIHEYFASFDIYHCGRGGNYVYCNLDKAYKQGIDLARKIVENKK